MMDDCRAGRVTAVFVRIVRTPLLNLPRRFERLLIISPRLQVRRIRPRSLFEVIASESVVDPASVAPLTPSVLGICIAIYLLMGLTIR